MLYIKSGLAFPGDSMSTASPSCSSSYSFREERAVAAVRPLVVEVRTVLKVVCRVIGERPCEGDDACIWSCTPHKTLSMESEGAGSHLGAHPCQPRALWLMHCGAYLELCNKFARNWFQLRWWNGTGAEKIDQCVSLYE